MARIETTTVELHVVGSIVLPRFDLYSSIAKTLQIQSHDCVQYIAGGAAVVAWKSSAFLRAGIRRILEMSLAVSIPCRYHMFSV